MSFSFELILGLALYFFPSEFRLTASEDSIYAYQLLPIVNNDNVLLTQTRTRKIRYDPS